MLQHVPQSKFPSAVASEEWIRITANPVIHGSPHFTTSRVAFAFALPLIPSPPRRSACKPARFQTECLPASLQRLRALCKEAPLSAARSAAYCVRFPEYPCTAATVKRGMGSIQDEGVITCAVGPCGTSGYFSWVSQAVVWRGGAVFSTALAQFQSVCGHISPLICRRQLGSVIQCPGLLVNRQNLRSEAFFNLAARPCC